MRATLASALALAFLVMAGCATRQRASDLDETLQHYNALIRWSEYAAAADYYDPELRRDDPITRLEMERLAQFRVSGYNQRVLNMSADGTRATQVAEIRLYNIHDLTERTIVDRQGWRYDAESERWWLTSGLPDVTQGRGEPPPREGQQ